MPRQTWEVEFHPACEAWADDLSQEDKEALLAAKRVLASEGQATKKSGRTKSKGRR